MPKIAIIYKTIPRYRRDFFDQLRSMLAKKNVDLLLFYGQPSRSDALKNDTVDLDWAIKVQSNIFEIGGFELYWQPVLPYLRDVDMVIVEQASKLLLNCVLMLQHWIGIRKLAFWGHGKNFQETSANPLAEWIKRQMSTRVHWWFAYNEMSARVVREIGFPAERITLVQNAVDTHYLTRVFEGLTSEEIDKVRSELNLYSANVGIYAGSLYPEKRIHFLLEALQLIRQEVPDFEMIFIGGGVDARFVEEASSQHAWIHYVGPKFDSEKIPYYAVSKIFLMPSLIGLGILDTFALETPLVTTNAVGHGPEISYLENNVNGIMVDEANNPQVYANAAIHLLKNEEDWQTLVNGCRSARNLYTVENMVERFAEGALRALKE